MKRGITGLLVALPFMGMAQSFTYHIKATLRQAEANSVLRMTYILGDKNVVEDSATANNGVFVLTGKVEKPVKARLVLDHTGTEGRKGRDVYEIYLEPGNILITSKDSIRYATITAGKVNADHETLKVSLKTMDAEIAHMAERYKQLQGQAVKDTPEVAAVDSGWNVINQKMADIRKAFIVNHPASAVSLDVLKMYAGPMPDYTKVMALMNTLSPAIRNSADGKAYLAKLNKTLTTGIGQTAPDFVQADTAGHPVHLSSFRGKYVLLDFWASWCGPCRAENPNVVKAYEKYKSKNFTIVGVSLDNASTAAKWLAAIHADDLNWTQLSDLKGWQNEVAKLYSVEGIPQNFLIDPSGKIIAQNLRGDELAKRLATLL